MYMYYIYIYMYTCIHTQTSCVNCWCTVLHVSINEPVCDFVHLLGLDATY